MLNHNYTFTEKATGPTNCMTSTGKFYGNLSFTWNFNMHWPVITLDYAENQTAKDLTIGAGGDATVAEAELLKIAKLSKTYIFNRLPLIARDMLEYRVAKDTELLQQILDFQIEILQTWGGYQSLYRVTEKDVYKSIGRAGEEFIRGTNVFATYYNWQIPDGALRGDY